MVNNPDKNSNIPTWIDVDEAALLLNRKIKTVKDMCRAGKLNYRVLTDKRNKTNYYVKFSSLPEYARFKVFGDNNESKTKYSEAPEWAKHLADKYIVMLNGAKDINGADLKGVELKDFILNWNENNPDNTTSYASILRMRKRYYTSGIAGLLAKYGKNACKTKVTDKDYSFCFIYGNLQLASCIYTEKANCNRM